MSYNNEAKCTCAAEPPRQSEPLTELMQGTSEVGLAILDMAERIESNLFGPNCPREEKCGSPMCHREALEIHCSTLIRAADTLSRVCSQLGV